MSGREETGTVVKQRRRRTKAPSRRWLVLAGIAALAVILALIVFRPSPAEDLDELMRGQGFVPNPGFAATFRPGDVIQVKEGDGQGGERRLTRPVLVLRREECFPGLEPAETAFAIPGRTGRRRGSLNLSGKGLSRFLPALGGEGAKAYELVIGNPRVATFAKADLSERFSPSCVSWFERELAAGDQPGWFETVIEAIVADELALTIEWETEAGAEARARLAGSARKGLPGGKVETALDTSEKQVLRSTGPAVLGYRTRPMEPVLNDSEARP
jgi:hypothetical protein